MSARAKPNREPTSRIFPAGGVPKHILWQLAEAIERDGGTVDDLSLIAAQWERGQVHPISEAPADAGRAVDERTRRKCERRELARKLPNPPSRRRIRGRRG